MFSVPRLIAAGIALALLAALYFAIRSDGYNAHKRETTEAQAREIMRQANRADRAMLDGIKREATLKTKLQETQHALKAATTGRACLGGAALRVLDNATGLQPPAGLSQGRPAAAAADSEDEEASDTAVAGWIAVAGDYYERCRARIRDIRCVDDGGCE